MQESTWVGIAERRWRDDEPWYFLVHTQANGLVTAAFLLRDQIKTNQGAIVSATEVEDKLLAIAEIQGDGNDIWTTPEGDEWSPCANGGGR